MFKQSTISYPSILNHPLLRHVAMVGCGALLVTLCAQINIPLEPVPVTLQTVGVMLIALTFKRKTALEAILCYVVLGTIGVPVFAEFLSGPQVFLGPTGGYLVGFIASVAAMTTLRPRLNDQNILHIGFNCLLGTVIIYVFGISRLSMLIGFKAAIQFGLLPFILPGIVKILLLSSTLRYLRPKRARV